MASQREGLRSKYSHGADGLARDWTIQFGTIHDPEGDSPPREIAGGPARSMGLLIEEGYHRHNNMTSRIIYAALGLLAVIGLASFFFNPLYEKGVWVVLIALSNCLSAALGAKFGLATATLDTPGSTTVTKTQQITEVPPSAE